MRTALLASLLVHVALIAVAIDRVTGPRALQRVHERVELVELRPAEAKPAQRAVANRRPESPRLAKPPHGFQILIAPVEATASLPSIDLTHLVTREADFSGRGVVGGRNGDDDAGVEPVDDDRVDRPALLLPGQMGPTYPDALRDEAPDGVVVVRFVIDTAGRVETPSLSVMRATHQQFADAVRAALDRLVYSPAQVDGHSVRVRMMQRFEFHLASR